MTAGDRLKKWIDATASGWADRLATWGMGVAARGITKALEDMEPGAIDAFRDALTKTRDNPLTPPEMVKFYDKALKPGNWFVQLIGGLTIAIGAIPALLGAGVPLGNLIRYSQDDFLKSYRLDPMSVITAWRRDPEKYAYYFEDLKNQGWGPERIEALKFVTEVMPSPRDIVDFLAHEVFEPDMIDKYRLLSEWDDIEKGFAKKIGVSEDILKLYWMDHWKHPEWGTIQELRHRGKITDQDVKDWFRLVEIPEYWRDPLLETLWGLPNRIEIRMMARYLDMSKQEIMDLLEKAGLHKDYRADAADFMMIMGLTGYWADMLSKGWMTPDEVKADIDARGLKPVTAERIYKSLVKATKGERTAAEKELTKAEIIKGVKKEKLTWQEGIELLMDLNYDEWEADYLLAINIAVAAGSPESYAEFKDITQKYRKASGLKGKPMNEEIRKAAAEVIRLTGERDSLQRSITEEQRGLIGEEILPAEATTRLNKLKASLRKAEAALSTAKTEYNRLVAEGKYT